MMMFGLHFMKEVPFRRVLLSGLIVDETGDKMSKVKGNMIDPLDLIHGAEGAAMSQFLWRALAMSGWIVDKNRRAARLGSSSP